MARGLTRNLRLDGTTERANIRNHHSIVTYLLPNILHHSFICVLEASSISDMETVYTFSIIKFKSIIFFG